MRIFQINYSYLSQQIPLRASFGMTERGKPKAERGKLKGESSKGKAQRGKLKGDTRHFEHLSSVSLEDRH